MRRFRHERIQTGQFTPSATVQRCHADDEPRKRNRDNLSTTGEAPHAVRNHWKKKQRAAVRARRTAERIQLETRPDELAPVRRRTVRKWSTPRLGESIAAKLEARAEQTPRKSAATRDRRRSRRGKRRKAKS